MSGLAGIIDWTGRGVSPEHLDGMLDRIRHRGRDGLGRWKDRTAGLGQARHCLLSDEPGTSDPLRDPDRGLVIVADARLYNRDDLTRRLGLAAAAASTRSDAALLLAAYARWDTGMLQEVDGDFAFAIWDEHRRSVFAARDTFGVKPFFFAHRAGQAAFGSEPKQLLGLPFVRTELDDLIVGEFLFRKFEDTRRTFFEDVRRLRPAHYVVLTAEHVEERRYWNPDPRVEIHLSDPREYAVRFHEVFAQAVDRRLEGPHVIGAQLSGGFDSSSIVATAGELQQERRGDLPPIETLSAVFPGLGCDESPYIDAVSRRVPFRNHRFRPLEVPVLEGIEDDFRQIDSPFVDLGRGVFVNCARILADRGGRLLVTGIGGDELVHEEVYLRDLARRGQFLRLVSDAWRGSRTSWNPFSVLLADAIRAAAPEPMRAFYRRVLKRPFRPPEWANPDFALFFASCPEAPPPATMGFRSLTQEMAFQFLTYPGVGWAIEALEARSAHHGLEVRHPFLDRPLAEFLLSIPFEGRRFRGRWKQLLRDAQGERLPSEVQNRPRKTTFEESDAAALRAALPQLQESIGRAGSWASERYVEHREALRLLDEVRMNERPSPARVAALWRIITLELWLRRAPWASTPPPSVGHRAPLVRSGVPDGGSAPLWPRT